MEKEQLSDGDRKMDLFYREARQRVSFRIHLTIYILVNLFIWNIWYFFFGGKEEGIHDQDLPTIFAITFCWLLAIILHYLIVFKWKRKMVEKEMKKLIINRRIQIEQERKEREVLLSEIEEDEEKELENLQK